MGNYSVEIEIAGPTALWARPDTLPNPVSYRLYPQIRQPAVGESAALELLTSPKKNCLLNRACGNSASDHHLAGNCHQSER